MGAKQEKAESVHEDVSSHPEADAKSEPKDTDIDEGKPLAQGRGKFRDAEATVVAAFRLNQDSGLDVETEIDAEKKEESGTEFLELTFVGNSTGSFVRTLKLFQWSASK